VNYGLNLDLRNGKGDTLLASAIIAKNSTIANYLLDNGANVSNINQCNGL